MSNIVEMSKFSEKSEVKENFKKKVDELYLNCMEEYRRTEECKERSNKVDKLRKKIISQGVSEKLVDELLENAYNSVNEKIQFVEYNIPEIFFNV